MSGYAGHRGRGRINSNFSFHIPQYTEADSHYEDESGAYDQYTGDNYNQHDQSYQDSWQETDSYDDQSYQETGPYENSAYEQQPMDTNYQTDYNVDAGHSDYDYYEQQTSKNEEVEVQEEDYQEGYNYEYESSYGDQGNCHDHSTPTSDYQTPTSDYHNYTSGHSKASNYVNRGANSSPRFPRRGSSTFATTVQNQNQTFNKNNQTRNKTFNSNYQVGSSNYQVGNQFGSNNFYTSLVSTFTDTFQKIISGGPARETGFSRGQLASTRGQFANLSTRGQFANLRNQSQNQFGSRGSANNFGRGRGRGQYNQKQSIPQGSKSQAKDLEQFGSMLSTPSTEDGQCEPPSEGGESAIKKEQGQSNSPQKTKTSLSSVKSPKETTNLQETKGLCEPEKESVKTIAETEPADGKSKEEQLQENKSTGDKKTEEIKDENEEDSDSSDEDTDYCKYCKMSFTTAKAFHTHTRGLQHTTLVMEAKAKKGDKRFQKEAVDASVLEVHIPAPKPPEPEPEPVEEIEEDEFEDNWMNLDEDVVKYIKGKRNPETRDLTPDELGKTQLPDDFCCALCNIKCTGAGAFKMHIEGRQHRSNIEAAKQGAKIKKKKQASTGVMVETKDRESKFAEMTKDNTAPMLGLEFVTEFQKTDFKATPRYVCNLCESKCDGATIVPHVIGIKHRLKFMQIRRPTMYDHLTKFNSKRKKSEMNANMEDFAQQIEQEVGRGDVRIKVELEEFDDEDELKETMIRHSQALAEKVRELEEGIAIEDEPPLPTIPKPKEPPVKKPRLATQVAAERRSKLGDDAPSYGDHRRDPYYEPRRPYDDPRRPYDDPRKRYDDLNRPPYDDFRRQFNDPARPPYDVHRRPYHDPARPPYDNPRRPYNDPRRPYDDPRRPYDDPRRPYDDPRDPYGRRRFPEDFRASYRNQFDPYRLDDPMYERRMIDEKRRLDGLMGKTHQLNDPFAERRRVEDIMERRKYLDEIEKGRLDDILERKKRLQETDVDYLRMQRFKERDVSAASSSPSLSKDEQKRLDDVLARREALKASESQDSKQSDVQAIQDKLTLHKSNDPAMAAKQEQAAKDLKEEAARNPNVNIGKVMANLSSSMIATEDDAAMALQISNALTQALLKYRLQNAPKELSDLAQSLGSALEEKPAEPSIPGLGTSTTSNSVPSFLRTSQPAFYSSEHSISGGNTQPYASDQSIQSQVEQSVSSPYLQTSTMGSSSYLTQISVASSYSSAPGISMGSSYSSAPGISMGSSYSSAPGIAGVSQSFMNTLQQNLQPQYSQAQNIPANQSGSYPAYTQRQPAVTAPGPVQAPAPAMVQHPAQVNSASQKPKKNTVDTSNVDQPQKMLLESIRKQTELLRQKIQGSSGIAQSGVNTSAAIVQSQTKHVPGFKTAAPVSVPGQTAASLASRVTSSTNEKSATSYSSQFYQQNYHTNPPNSAPAPPLPVQPPLPSEPDPPLPTNDLPPIRWKRHR